MGVQRRPPGGGLRPDGIARRGRRREVGRFVPQLLVSPYAGVIADRFERVGAMIASDLVAGAMQLGLAVAVLATAPVTLLIVLAGFTAVACSPYEPATSAVLPEMVEEDHPVAANALRGVIGNVVQVAGPAAGALLLIFLPDWSVFALNGASFAVSALVTTRIRYRSRRVDVTEAGAAGPLRQMLVGLREIGRSSRVALVVGLCLLASFIYGTDTVLLLGAAEDRLALGADGFGLLLAGLAVGGALAAATVNRLAGTQRLALVLIVGMAVYCLPNLLLAVSGSPALAIAAQALRGAGTLVVDVLAVTALQRAVAPDVTARVFGVFFLGRLSSPRSRSAHSSLRRWSTGSDWRARLSPSPSRLSCCRWARCRASCGSTRQRRPAPAPSPHGRTLCTAPACSPPRRGRCSSGWPPPRRRSRRRRARS